MTPRYGTVPGEQPGVLHLLSTIAARSCCGKAITLVPAGDRPKLIECARCKALDQARREGIPEWFSD